MAEDDIYTKDGTVDYRGNPAKRKETGTWKACPYILGMFQNPFIKNQWNLVLEINGN